MQLAYIKYTNIVMPTWHDATALSNHLSTQTPMFSTQNSTLVLAYSLKVPELMKNYTLKCVTCLTHALQQRGKNLVENLVYNCLCAVLSDPHIYQATVLLFC